MRSKLIHMATIAAVAAVNLNAQVVISTFNSPVTVDFDSGLAGVNNGAFAGTGIVAAPAAGQLDSDAWRVTGLSAGDTTFGGDFTAASFTRGSSTGGITASGLHAFDVGGGNLTMGIQPALNDFNPGTITLRIQNNTGGTVNTWDLSYDLFVFNDQNRSHSWDWAWSTDDITYTNLHQYASPAGGDTAPVAWSNVASPSASNLSASVVDGGYLYLQWSGQDLGLSGGRDELAIDNVSVTAVPEPATGALLVGGLGLLLVLWRQRG
jgi:hypothetical protein